jgi:antitoxin (DNA-binding transcriptional repressor) of toxin-antitoxin stability system
MKTVTAKEFQRQHASIVRDVANGHEYEVTFHRKPLIKLVPTVKVTTKTLEPGSHSALIESLNYTILIKGDLKDLPYKQLRNQALARKYGK